MVIITRRVEGDGWTVVMRLFRRIILTIFLETEEKPMVGGLRVTMPAVRCQRDGCEVAVDKMATDGCEEIEETARQLQCDGDCNSGRATNS